jgi:hypothetical protein
MQSVIYIIAIGSIGTFLLWTVHKYERITMPLYC